MTKRIIVGLILIIVTIVIIVLYKMQPDATQPRRNTTPTQSSQYQLNKP